MNDAYEGQVAVEVTCGCPGAATLVRGHMADDWRCGACRKKGARTGRRVTLGPRGALPADWRDEKAAAA